MRTAVAVLDQGRKAITITSDDNGYEGIWSGVTRSTAPAVLKKAGWKLARGASWEISPYDNGHVVALVHE